MMAASQGSVLDTFDTKSWLVCVATGTGIPAIMIGPYDGSTTPVT